MKTEISFVDDSYPNYHHNQVFCEITPVRDQAPREKKKCFLLNVLGESLYTVNDITNRIRIFSEGKNL